MQQITSEDRHMLPLTESDTKTNKVRKQVVQSIVTDTAPHAIFLADIQAATRKEQDLKKLIPLIQAGNHHASKSDPDLAKYALVLRKLSCIEGVVTRAHQMVIPKSLQEQVNNICHEGHLRIVKAKQLLRTKVWFPGIDKSVERKIPSCIPCQSSTDSSQRESPEDVSNTTMTMVASIKRFLWPICHRGNGSARFRCRF